jgi:hypothetical protein
VGSRRGNQLPTETPLTSPDGPHERNERGGSGEDLGDRAEPIGAGWSAILLLWTNRSAAERGSARQPHVHPGDDSPETRRCTTWGQLGDDVLKRSARPRDVWISWGSYRRGSIHSRSSGCLPAPVHNVDKKLLVDLWRGAFGVSQCGHLVGLLPAGPG